MKAPAKKHAQRKGLYIAGGIVVLGLLFVYVRKQPAPAPAEAGVAQGPPMPVGYGGGGGGGSETPFTVLPPAASLEPSSPGEQRKVDPNTNLPIGTYTGNPPDPNQPIGTPNQPIGTHTGNPRAPTDPNTGQPLTGNPQPAKAAA